MEPAFDEKKALDVWDVQQGLTNAAHDLALVVAGQREDTEAYFFKGSSGTVHVGGGGDEADVLPLVLLNEHRAIQSLIMRVCADRQGMHGSGDEIPALDPCLRGGGFGYGATLEPRLASADDERFGLASS